MTSKTPQQSPSRHVAMKDSWSHGDDRRGRAVDRGVTRPRRSRSPTETRRPDSRDAKPRDRTAGKSRPNIEYDRPPRDRSPDRRRRSPRSPIRDSIRDSREEVRERNKGRELLDDGRGSDKPKRSSHHSPSAKRRKSRSPSPSRSHRKKSRRASSRSPARGERGSSRSDKKHRAASPTPIRKRSPDHKSSEYRGESRHRQHRDSGVHRGRSPSPRHDRRDTSRQSPPRRRNSISGNHRSPRHQSSRPRNNSPTRDYRRRSRTPPNLGSRNSPGIDSYIPDRSRNASPRASRPSEVHRVKGRASEIDEYRPDRSGRPDHPDRSERTSGKSRGKPKAVRPAGGHPDRVAAASGANSIEVKSDRMAYRGFQGGQQGFHQNPMAQAFPLKPQPPYQQAQVDPRQYSQSPQHNHMSPHSHQSSPYPQSPYNAGRGNWVGQQQYQNSQSPQPQYPQVHQQQAFTPPTGPQAQFYAQSPPFQAQGPPSAPAAFNYQNSRGRGGAYNRGNGFPARGRGDHRARGGHPSNPQWNNAGAGRGQHPQSGNVTPQHASPASQQQAPPPPAREVSTQNKTEEEDSEDLFRPSKELQVEDKNETKKKDEVKMPPPSRPPPTGPQSQQNAPKGFSFAFKASSKAPPTAPKPEISQKLNAAPSRPSAMASPERSRLPPTRPIPTQPASNRRHERERDPGPLPKRMIKKIMKREKPRPQLEEHYKTSASVYYRKPGNESVVGSGTYGKVFKAVHVYTKDMVALKKIRMEGERDGFPVTAIREIKLLQSLKHINIVNMQEVMVEKNDCFMVFEYLSHDLTGLLNHPSFKLEATHKKHLAKQLFEGLDYLHRRGVLHRDIKAANILVSSEGLLKIADFGLARFFAKRRQLDYTNRVITIWYRSPELLLGETQYGPAVDIWSAACVLVEIFTRHAIFPGDGTEISQLDKIYAIMGTPNKKDWPGLVDMAWFELLRPTSRRPNNFAEKYKERVTPAAYELLEAMLQYDPAKRPTASDILEHPYFTVEEPKPRQATELSKLDGDWHEFESKALRKENERKDKEARRQAQKESAQKAEKAERDKKRSAEEQLAPERDAKRAHSGMGPPLVSSSLAADPVK